MSQGRPEVNLSIKEVLLPHARRVHFTKDKNEHFPILQPQIDLSERGAVKAKSALLSVTNK